MTKSIRLALASALLAAALSGCALKSGDELLQVPKPPKSYLLLQNKLDGILTKNNFTYATPESGQPEFRSSVQRINLDGDGEDEVVAFFKDSTTGVVNVFVYQKYDEDYIEMGKITGHGTALESVSYPLLSPTGGRGILLCWRLADGMGRGMTVCAFENGTLKQVLDTEYTDYTTADLDGDSCEELITIIFEPQGIDPASTGRKYARLWDYEDGKMSLVSQAAISQEAKSIARVRSVKIADETPAVLVESRIEGDVGMLTDILVSDESGFRNVAMDMEQGVSMGTYRQVTVYAADINADGMTEIPSAIAMPGYENNKPSETVWMLDWYLYSTTQPPRKVCTTYNNAAEGWVLDLPDSWRGNVTAVKRTLNGTSYTSFEEYHKGGENVPVLEIFSFTGDDHAERASASGMVRLGGTTAADYAARLPASAGRSAFAMTEEEIKQRFSVKEWS